MNMDKMMMDINLDLSNFSSCCPKLASFYFPDKITSITEVCPRINLWCAQVGVKYLSWGIE